MSDTNFKLFWPSTPEIFLPQDALNFEHQNCSVCNKPLINEMFLVEKSFWQDKTMHKIEEIFEIFICAECAKNFDEQISEESRVKVEQFQQKHFNHAYLQKLVESNNTNINRWLKYCVLTKQKISEVEEFNIVGQFFGNKMLYGELPMAISLNGLEKVEELYSNKTRDIMDDFMNQLPPDVQSSIKDKSKIFL